MPTSIRALSARRDTKNVKFSTKSGCGGAPFSGPPGDSIPGLGTLRGGGTGLTESFCLHDSALLSC